eukprot:gene1093-1160_t
MPASLRLSQIGPKIRRFSTSLCSSHKDLRVPEGFTIPEPKPLAVTDGNYLGLLKASAGTALRVGSGAFVIGWNPFVKGKGEWPGTLGYFHEGSSLLESCARPSQPIIIYEYEASPYCRKVREACTMLDLSVEYRPCPGARTGWSDHMTQFTNGKRTVPFMIDTGKTQLFESDDIIEYLFTTYGPGKEHIPWTLKGGYAVTTCAYAASFRDYAGSKLLPNARNDVFDLKPLTLWGYEGSPFVKIVRETLNSLGLCHILINCARGSANREKLYQITKRFQVPYLQDPNTGIDMFESPEIVKYLKSVYTQQT